MIPPTSMRVDLSLLVPQRTVHMREASVFFADLTEGEALDEVFEDGGVNGYFLLFC